MLLYAGSPWVVGWGPWGWKGAVKKANQEARPAIDSHPSSLTCRLWSARPGTLTSDLLAQ